MKIVDWNIYDANGSYLGKVPAFAPVIAFCRHMQIKGESVAPDQVASELLPDGTQRLMYHSEEFNVYSTDSIHA